VALVLGGGGARGLAQIGAIEELLRRGYVIHSVAGTSMGAIVGGFYVCGQLEDLKETIDQLSRRDIMSLIDFSLGLDHIASGDKLEALINDMLQGAIIEELPMSFCCCASDLVSGQERVFTEGSLAHAIRASISIPGFFKPVSIGDGAYVDGSVHNIFPLNRVKRERGDILVGINVSAPDEHPNADYITKDDKSTTSFLHAIRSRIPFFSSQFSENYINLALRVARIAMQNATQIAMQLNPPDICVNVPMDRFGLFDYTKNKEIIEYGRKGMAEALDKYEGTTSSSKQ
jgi:NTE family protein